MEENNENVNIDILDIGKFEEAIQDLYRLITELQQDVKDLYKYIDAVDDRYEHRTKSIQDKLNRY